MNVQALKSNTLAVKVVSVLLLSLLFLFAFTAKADASTYIVPNSEQKAYNSMYQKYSGTDLDGVSGEKVKFNKVMTYSAGKVTFNADQFDKLDSKSQKKALSYMQEINYSEGISKTTQRGVEKAVESSSPAAKKMMIAVILDDSGADMSGGYSILSGALPLIKVLFGVLTYILIYGLILSTILDFAYLGLPMARNIGTGGNGGEKPAWITTDAYMAVQEAEQGEKKSNVYMKYIIKRSWTYILFVLGVTWLIVGNMGDFITSIMALGDGFLNLN